MSHWKTLADIRREYGDLSLDEDHVHVDPLAQFQLWFSDIIQTEISDPTAMVLSTVDEEGHPDSRVVLLKGIEENQFIFYTNYHSVKSQQLQRSPFVALNFYWPSMSRQVCIRGQVQVLDAQLSDDYFSSRPLLSQWSAMVSPQSAVIKNRAQLEQAFKTLQEKNQQPIIRPQNWGGYRVIPHEIEFWQGRDNRLHDRIQYRYKHSKWTHHRLAP